MSAITTHVLDTARGVPAAGVAVTLERVTSDGVVAIGSGVTDTDGRLRSLLGDERPQQGTYRLRFDTRAYDAASFYPEVTVTFEVRDPAAHYHVPLLLSPFGYSTYRGS
jgi:5-hydroxyisourate hydrolase